VLKLILPPFRPWEKDGGARHGIITTRIVMTLVAVAGAIAAVLLVIVSGRK
jgi:hypothetical protein